MNKNAKSPLAVSSGTVSLGGELTVNRLGFGAMRITGDGIWGPPKDPRPRSRFSGGRLSWASTSSTRLIPTVLTSAKN